MALHRACWDLDNLKRVGKALLMAGTARAKTQKKKAALLVEGQRKSHLVRVAGFVSEQSAGRVVREEGGMSAECVIPTAKEEVCLQEVRE